MEVFRKIDPSLTLQEPFNDSVPPSTAVGNLHPNSQQRPQLCQCQQPFIYHILINCHQRTQLCRQPFIYYIQLSAMALRTELEPLANGAVNILDYHLSFIHRKRRNESSALLKISEGVSHWRCLGHSGVRCAVRIYNKNGGVPLFFIPTAR